MPVRPTTNSRSVALALLALSITGCSSGGEQTQSSTTATSEQVSATASTTQTTDLENEGPMDETLAGGSVGRTYDGSTFPSELTGIVGNAIADLAVRLEIDPAEVDVSSVAEVVWSDSSLGCPLPGMSYAQSTVDGLRIVLGVSRSSYDYRSGGLANPVLCEQPRSLLGTTSTTIRLGTESSATESGSATSTTAGDDPFVDQTPKDGGESDVPTEGINPPDK